MHQPLTSNEGTSLRPYNTFWPARRSPYFGPREHGSTGSPGGEPPRTGPCQEIHSGGGSNLVLTQDVQACVIKVEIKGRQLLETRDDAWIVEVGAGEVWHDTVQWCLNQGLPGLENMALIPGTVGAAPVQNIGAYGIELKDRFESLDAVDLITGRMVTLNQSSAALATVTASSRACWRAKA